MRLIIVCPYLRLLVRAYDRLVQVSRSVTRCLWGVTGVWMLLRRIELVSHFYSNCVYLNLSRLKMRISLSSDSWQYQRCFAPVCYCYLLWPCTVLSSSSKKQVLLLWAGKESQVRCKRLTRLPFVGNCQVWHSAALLFCLGSQSWTHTDHISGNSSFWHCSQREHQSQETVSLCMHICLCTPK